MGAIQVIVTGLDMTNIVDILSYIPQPDTYALCGGRVELRASRTAAAQSIYITRSR